MGSQDSGVFGAAMTVALRVHCRTAFAVLLSAVLAGCTTKPPRPAVAPLPVVTPAPLTLDEAHELRRAGRLNEYERALVGLASSLDATTRRRAIALHGLVLFEQGRMNQAIPLLEQAAAISPEVAPFLRLRVVDAEAARGNLEAAARVATEVAAVPDTTAATAALLRLPAIRAKYGDRVRTDESWKAAMLVTIDEHTEAELVKMAKALAANGRADLAAETRMRLLEDYTSGRYTEETFGYLRQRLAALPPSRKSALAAKLARADRYDQALELFDQVPESAVESRAVRLRALFNSRHYDRVLEQTQGVVLDDPALVLLRARAAWREDRPQELLAGLDDLEKRFPESREAIEAKIIRAKYYVTDVIDYGRAVANLQAALAAGAAGKDGENLWTLGWTYTLQGRTDDALRTFERYIAAWPDGDWKTNSLFWSAKILDRLGRTAERDAKVQQLVAEFPFSYYSYRARELWPWGTPSSGRSLSRADAREPPSPTQAGEKALAMTAPGETPDSESRALAMTTPGVTPDGESRALGTATPGETAPSAGVFATWRSSGQSAPDSESRVPSPHASGERVAEGRVRGGAAATFPDLNLLLAQISEPRLAAVRELLDLDLGRDAAREMKAVAARYPSNLGVQFLLADVYARGGEPFRANAILQRNFRTFVRHGGENVPRRFWEILFPLAYWDEIRTEAAKYGHDPYLLASIIRQESGFEPSTVSNAGAVGLMQIMPEEAPRIASLAGLPPVDRSDLFDPPTNIAVGAAEYAQKLKLAGGNPTLAIAAYNAGEQAVGTWIEKTPVDDIDTFVESIPYAETRLYVKTVTRNRFEYRRIYEVSNAAGESVGPAN